MNFKRILVLAPHTDDGELGCGASLSRFIGEGAEVFYMAFSICEESVPEGFPKNILEKEVKKATEVLGIAGGRLIIQKYPVRRLPEFRQNILDDMIKAGREVDPDLVFIPSSFDIHQDHQTVFSEGRRAFKKSTILGYEFMWNNYSFGTANFIVVGKEDIEKKIKALGEYKSQNHRFYSRDRLVKGLASYRGLQIGVEYAEAFEVIRWILR